MRSERGLTLIEIMVAVALLAVIMLGLFGALYQSQRALRLSSSQIDVLAGGRAAMSLLVQDLQEAAAAGRSNVVNFAIALADESRQSYIGGSPRTNVQQDLFWITRENDQWQGIGYFVFQRQGKVGTLYRVFTNGPTAGVTNYFRTFEDIALNSKIEHASRVAEGIVHLELRAYDRFGQLYGPSHPYFGAFPEGVLVSATNALFLGPWLPDYVELELGLLDPVAYHRFSLIHANNPAAGRQFLDDQLGKLYLFRQRVPLRNRHEP